MNHAVIRSLHRQNAIRSRRHTPRTMKTREPYRRKPFVKFDRFNW